MAYKILIAGETGNHCLEMSYRDAFVELGHEVMLFDTKEAVRTFAKPGRWGYQLHRFFPVEAWLRKANKQLAISVMQFKPDLVLVFTGAEVLYGTFAWLKTVLPAQLVWYWADPLPNLHRYIRESLPLADAVLSYSDASLSAFQKLGAARTEWVPFGADLSAHYAKAAGRKTYTYDIGFIGSWRPEREKVLQTIHEQFPGLRFRISGPYWERCSYRPLKKIASTKPLFGNEFTEVVTSTFLNLNVMDDTNYPAVNMRFFEIMAAGGLELCSAAPEMNKIFKDREHILYFSDTKELITQIDYAMANKAQIEKMKLSAQELLLGEHLYRHRAQAILRMIL